MRDGRNIGVEIKRTDTPRVTPSMRSALSDLQLDALIVVYPGPDRFPLGPSIEAIAAGEFLESGLDSAVADIVGRR